MRPVFLFSSLSLLVFTSSFPSASIAQISGFKPVTTEILESPSPDDWLMLSRTYDEQRFSPLDQINRDNVNKLQLEWVRGLSQGTQQTIPIVYQGVMYVVSPIASVQALDGRNGDLIWEYIHKSDPRVSRPRLAASSSKSLAIYQDLIYYAAPDGNIVALDARDGKLKWQALPNEPGTGVSNSSAPIIVDGKVIFGQACRDQKSCFIGAYDALTGKQVWKFHTAAASGMPGGNTWGDLDDDKRVSSVWGLPGSYDPKSKMIFWGTANPRPYTRLMRHGDPDKIPRTAPSNLYTNSTLALKAESGELVWYYQHLPGDDWDADHAHERILIKTSINPDPKSVKWISPDIKRGEVRDIVITIGEAGGLWTLDRATGKFLWATPFPEDVPDFNISDIDVSTGKTTINWDKIFKKDKDERLVCFHNTRGYWPMAYHPGENSIFVAYHDYCLEMTADMSNPNGYSNRNGILRPGIDINNAHVLAKIDVSTGNVTKLHKSSSPGNGAVLATKGNLIFWGDLNRRFRAFDSTNGNILWESILGGAIQMSTITYAIDGKQYVAVMTGDGNSATRNPVKLAGITSPRGHNAIYVFALPNE